MNFKKLAENRYSTKQYDTTKKVSEKLIQELKEILILSPSSVNSQPWKFTFVSNEKTKNKLSKVSFHNESKIQEASHLVVFSVIDNLNVFEKQIEKSLPKEKIKLLKSHVATLSEEEVKLWLSKQVYISLGFFLSACASLNIDSTAMEGIETDKYAAILNIQDHKPLFAVCIGYRNTNDLNQPSKNPKSRLDMIDLIEDVL